MNLFLSVLFLTDSGSEKDSKAVVTEIRKVRRKVERHGEFRFESISSATEFLLI